MSNRISYAKAAPGVYRAMLSLHEHLQKEGGLDTQLLDLVYLRVSQINGCAFCINMHWKDLRAAGVSESHLYMLDAWRESPGYSPREQAALGWAEAVTRLNNQHVPDEVYQAGLKEFGEAGLSNLTLAIVAINGWNRLNVAFQTPPKLTPAPESVTV